MPTKTTPKDFFLHLGAIVALYVSVISLINLIFAIINHFFLDPLAYYESSEMTIRWTVSCLIIAYPLYFFLVKVITKTIKDVPERKNLWVHKWSSYLTIFLTSAVIATDLIVLINYFLGGEITTRFILKVIAVLVVALFPFFFYLYDLKRENFSVPHRNTKIIAWKASVIVALAIIGGILSVGSPFEARQVRFDQQRVYDLSGIQSRLISYWQNKGTLPDSLEQLNDPISSFMVPLDPETGESYEYTKDGNLKFVLCANFSTESKTAEGLAKPMYGDRTMESFGHGEGRTCFTRVIDPELYSIK